MNQVVQVLEENGTTIQIQNVLIMETIEANESRYMFMTRYTPFSLVHSIQIPRSQTVFVSPVADAVENHYRHALEFCITHSDKTFLKGIEMATTHLVKVLASKNETTEEEGGIELIDFSNDEDDEIEVEPTKH